MTPTLSKRTDAEIVDCARFLCDLIAGEREDFEGVLGSLDILHILVPEIERLQVLTHWIPIDERRPEDNTYVLAGGTSETGWFVIVVLYKGGRWLIFDPATSSYGAWGCECPSHWMYLQPPPPPAGASEPPGLE